MEDTTSFWRRVTGRVPQGLVLTLTIFQIYINNILEEKKLYELVCYRFKNHEEVGQHLQLQRITKDFGQNKDEAKYWKWSSVQKYAMILKGEKVK